MTEKKPKYRAGRGASKRDGYEYNALLKLEVLSHYSTAAEPVCACCGERNLEFLTLDHINGGGGADRRANGSNPYRRVRYQGFPPGFRVLCMNCNFAFGKYGYCPHHSPSELQARILKENSMRAERAEWGIKLTRSDVREIWSAIQAGEEPAEIATRFGISRQMIYDIRSGRTWAEFMPADYVRPVRRGKTRKLTDEQVREVRRRLQDGEPKKAIGQSYGVSDIVIRLISEGKTYRNVE